MDSPRYDILLITPEVPYPPTQGASLRNYYILKGLARDHSVSLFSASRNEQQSGEDFTSPLDDICQQVAITFVPERSEVTRLSRLLTLKTPDLAHRFHDDAFVKALIVHLEKAGDSIEGGAHDIVQIEGLELGHLIPVIRYHSPSSRIIYDAHNAETELQRRALNTDLKSIQRWPAAVYSLVQVRRLKKYESWACETADAVTAVSSSDARTLSQYTGGRMPAVVPNSIDVKEYGDLQEEAVRSSDILFVGKMDYRPNVDAVLWFAQKVWPLIKTEDPNVIWSIVGQRPHSRLAPLKADPNINITGYVERIQPHLSGTKVVILPFRMGSGTRLKLLQALASSKCVVSTSLGAEGFPGVGEEAVVIEDDAHRFAQSVLSLLADEAKRKEMGRSGRTYAEQYDWRRVIPLFNDVYNSLPTNRTKDPI